MDFLSLGTPVMDERDGAFSPVSDTEVDFTPAPVPEYTATHAAEPPAGTPVVTLATFLEGFSTRLTNLEAKMAHVETLQMETMKQVKQSEGNILNYQQKTTNVLIKDLTRVTGTLKKLSSSKQTMAPETLSYLWKMVDQTTAHLNQLGGRPEQKKGPGPQPGTSSTKTK